MGLTDTVTEVLEDFNKRKNKSEVWETLEKKLKKAGFKDEYNKLIHELDSYEAYEFLKVWGAINQHLNEKEIRWGNRDEAYKVMKTLSKLDDIEDVIRTITYSGYELHVYKDIPFGTDIYLHKDDVKIFETLAKDGLYKKYDSVFKALNKFGYRGVNSYKNMSTQVEYITNLASLGGDVLGAIYILVNNGYQIDEVVGLNRLDLKGIERILEENEKEVSEGKGGIPVYLYNTGNLELFQDYFTSLKMSDKKSVLKSILEYETKQESQEHNKIRDWLEKDYESLIREVGFEDVK